jgi:hypothetical protein
VTGAISPILLLERLSAKPRSELSDGWLQCLGGKGDGITTMALLSSWEANAVLPTMRAGGFTATLHLFAPRTSLAARLAEDLALCATPALPEG